LVGTITPLVEEAQRRRARTGPAEVVVTYLVASLLGGVALVAALQGARVGLGAVFPGLGGALDARFPAIVGTAAAYVLLAIAIPWLRLPQRNRQVPHVWQRRFGRLKASVAYSFLLGTGVATRINSPGLYLVPVIAFVSGSWQLAVVPALAFSFSKAATVVGASLAFSDMYRSDFDGLISWTARQRLIWTGVQSMALAALTVSGLLVWLVGVGG
jgi:hypothetical protein